MFYLYQTNSGEIKLEQTIQTQEQTREALTIEGNTPLAFLSTDEVTDMVAFCEGYRKAKQGS